MNVLDAGVFLMMNSDTGSGGVKTLATGGIYQLDAPDTTDNQTKVIPPYVIVRPAANVPSYTFGNTLAFNYAVHAIQGYAINIPNSDGVKVAGALADRLFALFLDANLTVSGKTIMCCRSLQEIAPLKERDDTNNRWIYSRGWLIESWLT